MAIDNKLPKGPSNSTNLGATPGTQRTAMNNVRTGGINPNMPSGPQVAKQQRSPFQQSISSPRRSQQLPAPASRRMPAPRPVGMTPQPISARVTNPAQGVITQGMPMNAGRGYNIFAGMGADEISGMNQGMGLSNMTNLPSVVSQMDRGTTGYGLKPGEPTNRHFMGSGEGPSDPRWGEAEEVEEVEEDETESDMTSTEASNAAIAAAQNQTDGIPDEEKEAFKAENEEFVNNYQDELAALKKQSQDDLDDAAARQLQTLLSGIDRQMAMAGMFGSSPHSTAASNAAADVANGLIAEYNKLNVQEIDNLANMMSEEFGFAQEYNILDLNMSQEDEQELFMNMYNSAVFLSGQEELDEDALNEILNLSEFFDETITDTISDYATGPVGQSISGTAKEGFMGILAQIQMKILEETMPPNATMTKEQAAQNYIGAASILLQAMNSYVLEFKGSQNPAVVLTFLDKLVALYGVELPPAMANLAF